MGKALAINEKNVRKAFCEARVQFKRLDVKDGLIAFTLKDGRGGSFRLDQDLPKEAPDRVNIIRNRIKAVLGANMTKAA